MEITVEIFIIKIYEEMRKCGQYSAAKTCQTVLRGLLHTANEESLSFSDLTPELLKRYEHCLLSHSCEQNTVSLYMRTLQTICRKAAEESVAVIPEGLFNKVFTGYIAPARRSIPVEIMRQLREAKLDEKNHRYAFARDMFLLSFYLRGIPFIDLAYLRKCDLKEGILTYRRRKTGKQACVQVEPCAMEIIRRYAVKDGSSGYLLPIIRKAGEREEERKQYDSALRLYNKHLKVLGEVLGLKVKLTSYAARHTWATTAHDIGVDIADISEALCHSSEKMTKNYIRSFTPDRLASVNRTVIACINSKNEHKAQKGRSIKGRGLFKREIRSGSL